MGGERAEGVSAPFAVDIADYRRAFTAAVASWPVERVPRAQVMARAVSYWWIGASLGLLAAATWAFWQMLLLGPWAIFAMGQAVITLIGVALVMVPAALLVAYSEGGDANGVRRRLPYDRSAEKRAQRMQVAWSRSGLSITGERGEAGFGWNALYAWIDMPAELVIFTAQYDPVPVPHAALSETGLADLRTRLHVQGVPQGWRPESGDAPGLKQLFG